MGYDMLIVNLSGDEGDFHRNLWGMGRLRDAMCSVGMMYSSRHPSETPLYKSSGQLNDAELDQMHELVENIINGHDFHFHPDITNIENIKQAARDRVKWLSYASNPIHGFPSHKF